MMNAQTTQEEQEQKEIAEADIFVSQKEREGNTISQDDNGFFIPDEVKTIDKSITPSILESERFIRFLNTRLSLGLDLTDLTILIHETSAKVKGYFRPKENLKSWCINTNQEEKKPINSIVLSSHTLKETPYETLAHELAHYINHHNGIKDCSGNQYHNKHFKTQAEKLLLRVERMGPYGYALTSETEEFKQLVQEFKPNEEAFKLFQGLGERTEKKKGRMIKYTCGCGCIIRTARNENKPLIAVCGYCNTSFEVDE